MKLFCGDKVQVLADAAYDVRPTRRVMCIHTYPDLWQLYRSCPVSPTDTLQPRYFLNETPPCPSCVPQCKGKHSKACLGEHNLRAVLLDTQGPEIRTGNVQGGGKIELVQGSTMELTTNPVRTRMRMRMRRLVVSREWVAGESNPL